MKLLKIMAIAASAMFASASAFAGATPVVLLSNLGSTGSESNGGGDTNGIQSPTSRNAASFTVGATSATISSIRGVFSTDTSSAVAEPFALAIYSDNAGSPGTLIATTATQNVTDTKANLEFTFSTPVAVTNGVKYWVVAQTIPNAGAKWYADFDAVTAYNSSLFAGSGFKGTTGFPTGWSDNVPLGFALLGNLNSAAVPEPALTSLLCLGGVALIRRRMKK